MNTKQAWYDWHVHGAPDTGEVVYVGAIDLYRVERTDGGWTWTVLSSKFDGIGDSIHPDQHCMAFDPVDANIVYAGCDGGIFRSPNRGTEVRLPSGDAVSAMALPTTDRVYAGTDFGDLFRIDWTGSEWATAVRLTSPREFASISDLLVDPHDARRIWATSTRVGAGRVFRSDDGGTTWNDRSAGLPALPINAVEVHPEDPDRVWVAADKGVYESRDGGATWSGMSLGLPNCLVADLLYHRHARVLRAGTRSRGVWECAIERVDAPICGVEWTGWLDPGETRTWATSPGPACWHVQWSVQPTTPGTGTSQLTWDVATGRADAEHAVYEVTVTNLTEQRVSIEGRFAILSYR